MEIVSAQTSIRTVWLEPSSGELSPTALLRRTLTKNFECVSQCLVNNGYSNHHINKSIKTTLEKWHSEPATQPTVEGNIKSYYRAYMNTKQRTWKNHEKYHLQNCLLLMMKKKLNLLFTTKTRKLKISWWKITPNLMRTLWKSVWWCTDSYALSRECLGTYIGMTHRAPK